MLSWRRIKGNGMDEDEFMRRAVTLSLDKMRANIGGPFGAIIVRHGKIVAESWNQVTATNDATWPTAKDVTLVGR
jgi:guanine deaminase